MLPVLGLFEAHLTVSDLDRSVRFYKTVLGLEWAHLTQHAAFFWLDGAGNSMLGLWTSGRNLSWSVWQAHHGHAGLN